MYVTLAVAAVWIVLLGGAWWTARRLGERGTVRGRLFAESFDDGPDPRLDSERGTLGRWLYLAGFRSPTAVPWFLAASLLGMVVGLGFAATVLWLGVVDDLTALLSVVPGGVGEVFVPFAVASPWLSAVLLAALPAVYVRSVRRRRVRMVEQDLPLILDLLSTLAEAGLGFDAALDRILQGLPPDRPLVREFHGFQIDVLAGRRRIDALRRLARRVEVTWFGILVSALVQAEQVGAGLAETLRTQAADLRHRRRERALELASALPVKLVFPLVLCFLPGLMTVVIGPTLLELVQVFDRILGEAGF